MLEDASSTFISPYLFFGYDVSASVFGHVTNGINRWRFGFYFGEIIEVSIGTDVRYLLHDGHDTIINRI